MHARAEIRSELLRLKCDVAALRFQFALRRHAIALKAGFDPDQPRDELGQWTDAGGNASVDDSDAADSEALDSDLGDLDSTDFSDVRRRPPGLPPIETLSNIPAAQPKTQQERNYVAQEVARNARLATEYLSEVATSANSTRSTGRSSHFRMRRRVSANCTMAYSRRTSADMMSTTLSSGYRRAMIVILTG